MNLKNYTSTVPVERSIMMIKRELVRAGEKHIAKSYADDHSIEGIIFQIAGPNGTMLTFKLPAKWDRAFELMMQDVRRPRPDTEDRIREQAQRTAWKILYDWVGVQISMIELGKSDAIEMFLPYAYDYRIDQTFYEKMMVGGFKQLTAGLESGR